MDPIEVKYRGHVVGLSYDNGKTIEFNDNIISDEIKREMLHGTTIGISSRQKGEMSTNNKIVNLKLTELNILEIDRKNFKQK